MPGSEEISWPPRIGTPTQECLLVPPPVLKNKKDHRWTLLRSCRDQAMPPVVLCVPSDPNSIATGRKHIKRDSLFKPSFWNSVEIVFACLSAGLSA